MHDLKLQLDAIDPRLWVLAIALLCWVLVQFWRSLSLASWWPASLAFERVPQRLRALPATVVAAVISASATDDVGRIALDVVIGAFSGLLAVGAHETVNRFRGADRPPLPPPGEE